MQDQEYLAAHKIMQQNEAQIAQLQAQVEELQGDVSRLTIENEQVKANFEHEMWGHAACLTLAEGNKDYPPIELQSLAMQKVIEVVQERDELKVRLSAQVESDDTAVIDEKPAKKEHP